MIKGYKGIEPKIDETAFVAESVDIIGKVNIGKNANAKMITTATFCWHFTEKTPFFH